MFSNTKPPETVIKPAIEPKVFLPLASGAMVFGLVVGHSLGQLLMEISQATEEVFRGERLPVFNFPVEKIKE
jgi:hypothetical protein